MNGLSKKKVLLLVDSIGPGGAQRQLVGLATFLKEHEYDVSVACYHDNRFYVEQLLKNDIPYIYLKKANGSSFRIWHVARFIRHEKPNVVISYLETPSICACVAKLFNHSFKLIVSERNTTQHTGRNETIRFNLFRTADYVVPNAYSQEAYIREVFPCLAKKTATIPNFVDLVYFTPVYKQRKSTPEIMVAASIWASKNTLGFIDAVALLKERGCNCHISWYGKSESNIDYYNQCQGKITQLGIEDYITLKEKTAQIKERYQESDLFCLPSFYEGTPNVLCEAMACGLPVLCSDVCDNGQYVKEGVNGYLFNPKDPQEMANKIECALLLSDDDYTDFCKKSRTIAEDKLSKKVFVEKYLKLLEK